MTVDADEADWLEISLDILAAMLAEERLVSLNTAEVGGNAALLSDDQI